MTVNFQNFPKVSKTNMLGILECSTAVIIAVDLLPPHAKWTVIFLAALRAIIRFYQTDADRLPPNVPGNPTNQVVDAHPVADIK